MKNDKDKSDKTLKRFQGDSFEVPSDAVWKVFYAGKMIEPLDCLEVREMLKNEKLSALDWVCKIDKDKWSRIIDVIDFNGRIDVEEQEIDGKITKKVFVRRSPRAIYYAPARIETADKLVLTGNCASLSTTGVFIEMVVSKIEKLKLGERIHVIIMADQVQKIESNAEIVQINLKTPKGVALRFVALDLEIEKKIAAFIKTVT